MSEMEKLVEEIKDRFCRSLCGGYNYGERICDCYPRVTWGTAQAQCSCLNDTVDFAITRIGKAYVEGLEIPGEVDRFDFHMKNWDKFEHWVAQALHDDADIFIAFRKEKERRE